MKRKLEVCAMGVFLTMPAQFIGGPSPSPSSVWARSIRRTVTYC